MMAEVLYTVDGKPISESNPLHVVSVGGGGSGGSDGKSLEFEWKGTELGVKVEGEEVFQYKDLKGAKGDIGPKGETGAKGADGAKGATGTNGAKGTDGIGITTITYDNESKELVFTMSNGTEQRVKFPAVE